MKDAIKYCLVIIAMFAGTSSYAASGVIELEIPGMNEETAVRIVDFRTNACPATVAALRDSIGADGVPVVGWNTQTSPSRTYKVFGKVDLTGSIWLEVNGCAVLYRYFKIEVEVR